MNKKEKNLNRAHNRESYSVMMKQHKNTIMHSLLMTPWKIYRSDYDDDDNGKQNAEIKAEWLYTM